MDKIRSRFLFVALCLSLLLTSYGSRAAPRIDLRPCRVGNFSAKCWTLSVFENRETNSGRKIDIHVAVIKASGPDPLPDPIFYLAGEPGGSAIQDAGYALLILKSANERRDVVLVDQRGTGESNRLTCPRSTDPSAGLFSVSAQIVQELQECLANLEEDPRAYTTAWAWMTWMMSRSQFMCGRVNVTGTSHLWRGIISHRRFRTAARSFCPTRGTSRLWSIISNKCCVCSHLNLLIILFD